MNLQKKVPDTFFTTAAALSLGCVLAVVLVSAAIRLGSGFSVLSGFQLMALRGIHRTAASLEVLAVLWLAWMAWSTRRAQPRRTLAAGLALAVTAFLSVLGILAGQNPPPAAAVANLLGGLALTAIFAWFLGALEPDARRSSLALVLAAGILLTLQVLLGARLSIVERFGIALPVHGLLAIALTAFLGWIGLARVPGKIGKLLFAFALAALLAGFTALHYEYSVAAALVHALAAAALVATAAFAFGRNA
jgi:heme A synthase